MRGRSARGWVRTWTCTTLPPVTGMLDIGNGASIERKLISAAIGWMATRSTSARSKIGARGTGRSAEPATLPGSQVGASAEIGPGSAVFDSVPDGENWSGAPARRNGAARGPLTQHAGTGVDADGPSRMPRVAAEYRTAAGACPEAPAPWPSHPPSGPRTTSTRRFSAWRLLYPIGVADRVRRARPARAGQRCDFSPSA